MKHNSMATANAAAVTTGVIFVACRILVGIFPNWMFAVAQSWLHGIKLTEASNLNISFAEFGLGLVTSVAFAWAVGYAFASLSNYFSRR